MSGEKKKRQKNCGHKKNRVFCEYENVALQAQKDVYQAELVSVVCTPLLNPWVKTREKTIQYYLFLNFFQS